jgi:hypothetical protein
MMSSFIVCVALFFASGQSKCFSMQQIEEAKDQEKFKSEEDLEITKILKDAFWYEKKLLDEESYLFEKNKNLILNHPSILRFQDKTIQVKSIQTNWDIKEVLSKIEENSQYVSTQINDISYLFETKESKESGKILVIIHGGPGLSIFNPKEKSINRMIENGVGVNEDSKVQYLSNRGTYDVTTRFLPSVLYWLKKKISVVLINYPTSKINGDHVSNELYRKPPWIDNISSEAFVIYESVKKQLLNLKQKLEKDQERNDLNFTVLGHSLGGFLLTHLCSDKKFIERFGSFKPVFVSTAFFITSNPIDMTKLHSTWIQPPDDDHKVNDEVLFKQLGNKVNSHLLDSPSLFTKKAYNGFGVLAQNDFSNFKQKMYFFHSENDSCEVASYKKFKIYYNSIKYSDKDLTVFEYADHSPHVPFLNKKDISGEDAKRSMKDCEKFLTKITEIVKN